MICNVHSKNSGIPSCHFTLSAGPTAIVSSDFREFSRIRIPQEPLGRATHSETSKPKPTRLIVCKSLVMVCEEAHKHWKEPHLFAALSGQRGGEREREAVSLLALVFASAGSLLRALGVYEAYRVDAKVRFGKMLWLPLKLSLSWKPGSVNIQIEV